METRGASGKTAIREIVADVQSLHIDSVNENALFQVASQFNLLEMVAPDITPERGVSGYEFDRTQGPACAVAAGAGTIYRNYFVTVNGVTGQSKDNQLDCLAELGEALGNKDSSLWKMTNGYALATVEGLRAISNKLEVTDELELDQLRGLLHVGIQWGTQVTLGDARHLISQIFCSALPVSYSRLPPEQWEGFSRLVLEAAYEATLCAGVLNCRQTGNKTVFLTLLGGGAFGNKVDWILAAAERAIHRYRDFGLDVVFVSYRFSDPAVSQLLQRLSHKD
ncbi:MAG: hypothetical protein ACWA44_13280 [Thiotrichales bacterium]